MVYAVLLIYFVLVFSFQTTLLDMFSVGGVTPDLALILALYFAIILRGDAGTVAGVAIGFIEDCFSGGLLGVNTLSKGIIGFVFTTLRKKIVVEGFVPIGIFLLGASIFDGLVFYLTSVFLFKAETSLAFLFPKLIIYALYNAAMGPPLFYVFNLNRKWLARRFPSFESSMQ